ncbi:MAG: hypothetical protein PHH37_06985 [Paludibacter sp.]|nr:hypothetical protein [Paludibacter sp.]
MPRNKVILKEQLLQLSKKELVDMVLKLSAKRFNYEYLLVNFLDPDNGEQILFEEALQELQILFDKEFKGRTLQHQRVKMLTACMKRIKDFTVETKNKKLEADLLIFILEHELSQKGNYLGAKYSGYDYKVALILKKTITIVTQKLHPDYLLDYLDIINKMLRKLHQTSERINTVRNLPENI